MKFVWLISIEIDGQVYYYSRTYSKDEGTSTEWSDNINDAHIFLRYEDAISFNSINKVTIHKYNINVLRNPITFCTQCGNNITYEELIKDPVCPKCEYPY